ncbi:hypothetical protein GQ600_22014 [Phytophthora cactorum]|nr:hypothetical protein GQ600_22014 [Phytophthora cactorum]
MFKNVKVFPGFSYHPMFPGFYCGQKAAIILSLETFYPTDFDIVAETRYSGLPGRVQDEQALLAVPPNAFGSSLLCGYEAPKRKKCKGVVLVRNRAEVEFEDKKCHAVLRCDHENYEARYWDRDVNAAINMVELLKSEC